MVGCPLGIDIPAFIRQLREADAAGALEIIHRQNPFPALCGRVCSAPCQTACILNEDGHPISIRDLERYAAEHGAVKSVKKSNQSLSSKKIAIIGSGPAGLMLAHQLAQKAYRVTVFEANHDLGGMLRYGIPGFRLPQKIVDDMIELCESMGVEFKTHAVFGRTLTMSELLLRGYGAIVLAMGAGLPHFDMGEGYNLGGVFYHSEWMMRVLHLNKNDSIRAVGQIMPVENALIFADHAYVLDSARLIRRAGGQVTVYWTGPESDLLNIRDLVEQSQEEGVVIKQGCRLKKLEGDDQHWVSKIHIEDMVENEDKVEEANMVVLDGGQVVNAFIRQHLPQLRFNEDGTIWCDASTGLTSVEKVFACGNAAIGHGPLINAMAHAKKVSMSVHVFMEALA